LSNRQLHFISLVAVLSTKIRNFVKFLFDYQNVNIYNIVGDKMNKLKELRTERGLTVRGIEDKTGIKFTTYARYESEERDMSTDVLKQLADFFKVSVDYLICHSSYCLYAKYKEGNFFFRIKEDYYKELKEKKYIYFDNNEDRCIDINSLIGVDKSNNILTVFEEFTRMNKAGALFEKGKPTEDEIKALNDEIIEIELNRMLVKQIKDAIK